MRNRRSIWLAVAMLLLIALLATACGPAEEEPTATPTKTLQPTWTSTPEVDTPTPLPPPATDTPVPTQPPAPAEPPTDTPEPPTATPEPATPTPETQPVAVVTGAAQVNVRSGPGTNYPVRGSAANGTELTIVGRNDAGDWWQVCCVSGNEVWIIDRLVAVQGDTAGIQVATNIPPPPAPTATRPPPPPTNTPEPAGPPDPGCGVCTFRVDAGPEFFTDTNTHVKMYFRIWIPGRQEAQGSYRAHVEHNGVDISDGKVSIAKAWSTSGGGRQYNLEFSRFGDPSGNYTIWLIDGNGNRASANVNFGLPAGQHEVWISFAQ